MKISEINTSVGLATNVDITRLLPQPTKQPKNLLDVIKPTTQSTLFNIDIYNILTSMMETRFAVIQFKVGRLGEVDSGANYEKYLQFPNAKIQALADSIVAPTDSDDVKMYKIEQWVIENIEYVSDIKNYGTGELWAYPTVTVEKGSGDCEDGAFLMHSLALHAGVSPNQLRTYGGIVIDYSSGTGIGTGGHAWTAYQRETDDEWIILDWCYWAKDTPIEDRMTMADNHKYIDDYFYIEANKTVETPYTNKVRYAEISKGSMIDIKI